MQFRVCRRSQNDICTNCILVYQTSCETCFSENFLPIIFFYSKINESASSKFTRQAHGMTLQLSYWINGYELLRDETNAFCCVSSEDIRITCPCNEHPLTPHFYIEKVGFTRVYIFFLFLLQNIDCGYSLEPPR